MTFMSFNSLEKAKKKSENLCFLRVCIFAQMLKGHAWFKCRAVDLCGLNLYFFKRKGLRHMCFLRCLSCSVFLYPLFFIFFFHFISLLHLLNVDINICFLLEYISIMFTSGGSFCITELLGVCYKRCVC